MVKVKTYRYKNVLVSAFENKVGDKTIMSYKISKMYKDKDDKTQFTENLSNDELVYLCIILKEIQREGVAIK